AGRCQQPHELRRGRACAEAEAHAVAHLRERLPRRGDLHLRRIHQYPPAAPPCRGSATAKILSPYTPTAETLPIESVARTPWPMAISASTIARGARSRS